MGNFLIKLFFNDLTAPQKERILFRGVDCA